MSTRISPLLLGFFSLAIAGCQTPTDEGGTAQGNKGDYSTIKPGAAVALDYAVQGEAELGSLVSVQIEVTSANSADMLQLSLSADESLQLNPAQATVQYEDVQPAVVQTHQLEVTPQRSGRLFINAIVTVDREGNQSARTFTVPIQVGPEVADKDATPADGGEQIHSLPAEES